MRDNLSISATAQTVTNVDITGSQVGTGALRVKLVWDTCSAGSCRSLYSNPFENNLQINTVSLTTKNVLNLAGYTDYDQTVHSYTSGKLTQVDTYSSRSVSDDTLETFANQGVSMSLYADQGKAYGVLKTLASKTTYDGSGSRISKIEYFDLLGRCYKESTYIYTSQSHALIYILSSDLDVSGNPTGSSLTLFDPIAMGSRPVAVWNDITEII